MKVLVLERCPHCPRPHTSHKNTQQTNHILSFTMEHRGIVGFKHSDGKVTYKICSDGIHEGHELLSDYDAPDLAKSLLNDDSPDLKYIQLDSSSSSQGIGDIQALLKKFDQGFVPGAERFLFFDETTSQWFATAVNPYSEVVNHNSIDIQFLDNFSDNKKHLCIIPLRDLVVASSGEALADFDIFEYYDEYLYSEVHTHLGGFVVTFDGSNRRKIENHISDHIELGFEHDLYEEGSFVFIRPGPIVDEEAKQFKAWQKAQINHKKRKCS